MGDAAIDARSHRSRRSSASARAPGETEADHTAAVLQRILVVIAVAVLVLVGAAPLLGGSAAVRAIFAASILCCCLLGLWLIRRSRVRAAVAGFSLLSWVAVTAGVLLFGGLHNSTTHFYLVHLLLVALLSSERVVLAYGVASCVALFAIATAETHGVLPRLLPAEQPHAAWFSWSVAAVISVSLLHHALGDMRSALASSRRSERRTAALVENSPDGILAIDAEGRIEALNPEACRILSCDRGVVGQMLVGLAWPGTRAGARLEAALRDAQAGRAPDPFELEVQRGSGTPLWLGVHLAAQTWGDAGRKVQLTLRDVSERRLAERERRHLETQLRSSEKLKAVGQLAGGVAHDFNNYLVVIRGCSEFALAEVPPGGRAAEALTTIEQAADRVEALTRQLLAFGRHRLLEPRLLDPNRTVGDMQRLLGRTLGEHVRLETSLAATACIRVDPALFEVALLNLAVNARDAMPGGGTLTIETVDRRVPAVDGGSAGSYVAFRLTDEGRGMDEAVQARIFEPFFTTKGEHGSGLGLSTVRSIVLEAGGDVSVTSAPGLGTTLEVLLPAHPGPPEPEAPRGPAPASGSGGILLVEDEERVRSVIHGILASAGYDVVTAANAHEALVAVEECGDAIDLVLSDVVMPGMAGSRLLEILRSQRPELPFILMSGYSADRIPHPADGREIGHLPKPFSRADLLRKVAGHLAPRSPDPAPPPVD